MHQQKQGRDDGGSAAGEGGGSGDRGRGRGSGRGGWRGGRGGGRGHGRGYGRGGSGHGRGYYGQYFLREDMAGFLCTCNFSEKDCLKEALNLLNEYGGDDSSFTPITNSASASTRLALSTADEKVNYFEYFSYLLIYYTINIGAV